METVRDTTCGRGLWVARWDRLQRGRYRDMVVYALGLGLTLLLAWFRDPYALY